MRETTDSNETTEESTAETARRTFLKGTAAAGTAVAGLSALTGSAAAQQGGGGNLLKNLDVTGTLVNEAGKDTGGTFDGKISITDFAFDGEGNLLTSGTIKGTAETADGVTKQVNRTFENVATNLLPSESDVCDVLFLDLGPLNLDVLGLQIDLSEITLDIDAARGPGNLLGNLLCAVANLLNQ